MKMVRASEQENDNSKSTTGRLFHFSGIFNTGRHAKNLSVENVKLDEKDEEGAGAETEKAQKDSSTKSEKEKLKANNPKEDDPKPSISAEEIMAAHEAKEKQLLHDMDQMKERFAKLLLGEDMSGGGKGVSSALALSNAITNLAASVFGEQWRLEPMSPERKARWRREIDILLSVTDHVVEFVASQQKNKDGMSMEVMVTKQRSDLLMNIPALKKLDAMLIDCLDNFKEQSEFTYVKGDAPDSEKGNAKRKDDKWWLPAAKVPENGLSDITRKFLQYQKDCVNQVLKAAMAINAQVLSEMEIPESYIESLPKNGRSSLGDSVYRNITVEFFDPDQFLTTLDMSSEHKILDVKNRIEASIVIWQRKMNQKDSKSTWGPGVSIEKRELFEERAETILLILKQRFPGLPQSALDISKIQYNRDVGQAVLESYSRILESLAHTVMSRIEDVLYADYVAQNPTQATSKRNFLNNTVNTTSLPKSQNEEGEILGSLDPSAMTLSDLLTWGMDQGDNDTKTDSAEEVTKDVENLKLKELNVVTNKKASYVDNIGGARSPTERH